MARPGKVAETVVAAIERSLVDVPGTVVHTNVKLPEHPDGPEREIDVLIRAPVSGRAITVGIEVRDRKDPVDLPDLDSMIQKLGDVAVDVKGIVSTTGFTADAAKKAARHGVETWTLAEIGRPDWWIPQHITVFQPVLTLLGAQLQFRDGTAEREFVGRGEIDLADIVLTDPAGASISLLTMASADIAEGLADAAREAGLTPPAFAAGKVGTFRILMNLPGYRWAFGGEEMPAPSELLVVAAVAYATERVKLTTYAGRSGTTAFVGESKVLGARMVVVAQQVEQGTRLTMELSKGGTR